MMIAVLNYLPILNDFVDFTTPGDGCLGSCFDEGRSLLRNAV